MCVQTITCNQQGKGRFRRTHMYTYACIVHRQSVCACMRDTGECGSFKPRANATINPKHTRQNAKISSHPQSDAETMASSSAHTKLQAITQASMQTASSCHTSNPPTKMETDSNTLSCRICMKPQDKSTKKTPRTWSLRDRVCWRCLLAFWMMRPRDSNCSGIRHSEKVSIQA
jgi:hypothetical protein